MNGQRVHERLVCIPPVGHGDCKLLGGVARGGRGAGGGTGFRMEDL